MKGPPAKINISNPEPSRGPRYRYPEEEEQQPDKHTPTAFYCFPGCKRNIIEEIKEKNSKEVNHHIWLKYMTSARCLSVAPAG